MSKTIIIEYIILSVSSICAVISIFYAHKIAKISNNSHEDTRSERKLQLHNQFQTNIRNLQKQLPLTVNDENYSPSDEDKRIITLFWYSVFDEWFICKKEHNIYSDLWDNIYSKGIKSAFKNKAFKKRIEEMFANGESSFFGYGREFKEVLDEICFDSTTKTIK